MSDERAHGLAGQEWVPFCCCGCRTILGLTTKDRLLIGAFQKVCHACGTPQEEKPLLIQRRVMTFNCFRCGEKNRWEPDMGGKSIGLTPVDLRKEFNIPKPNNP